MFLELAKDAEEDDVLYLLLDKEKQFSIGISYIVDIEKNMIIVNEEGGFIEGTPSSFYVKKYRNKYIEFRYCYTNFQIEYDKYNMCK